MGFKKGAAPEATVTPKADKPAVSQKKDYSPDEARVRGQVRTHVIKSARNSAALLAPTLANTAASIEDTWHRLTIEAAERDLKWVMED